MKPKSKKPVEVIVFEDPEKRKKVSDEPKGKATTSKGPGKFSGRRPERLEGPSPSSSADTRPVFDQKKAKHEIRKLGIYGMDKKNKEEAIVDLLVELGAKPPKRRCHHIQEYQRMQKEKKAEEREKEEMEKQAGVKKKKQRERRKRDKDDILNFVDGQAGFYKDGVQYVKGLNKR